MILDGGERRLTSLSNKGVQLGWDLVTANLLVCLKAPNQLF